MEQTWAILSLLLLVIAILLGFWRKINMGIIAIAFSFILGRCAGMKDSAVLGSFGTALFLRLLGVMLLFSVAQSNGTIEKLTKKLASLSGNAIRLIPIAIFVLFAALSALGAGGPAALALAALVTVPISYQLGISPLKLAPAGIWGGIAIISSISMVGILAKGLSADIGVEVNLVKMSITSTVGMLIVFAVWYVGSGWLKMEVKKSVVLEQVEPFLFAQYATIGGILLLVVLSLVINVDIGLAGFICTFVLFLIPGVVDERKTISAVPWNALVMIGGMGMLISVVQKLGGIDLLSNTLASMMTVKTAPAILSATGSIMSTVSSTTGVVMPTLIPTVPGIIEAIGGGNAQEMIYAITLGASQTVISPFSTGGALMLAAYANIYRPTTQERSKIFIALFVYAIVLMVVFAGLGLIGFYGFFL